MTTYDPDSLGGLPPLRRLRPKEHRMTSDLVASGIEHYRAAIAQVHATLAHAAATGSHP